MHASAPAPPNFAAENFPRRHHQILNPPPPEMFGAAAAECFFWRRIIGTIVQFMQSDIVIISTIVNLGQKYLNFFTKDRFHPNVFKLDFNINVSVMKTFKNLKKI